jgi:two-component system response regulator YesN
MTTVLLVDDEPLVRLMVRSLENWGEQGIDLAWEAANGREALATIAAHPDIDIVLADVDMPVMNGLELAETLHEKGATQDILFLSSFDTFEFARRAFKAGADDYILKSEMDEGRLLAALQKIVARRGSAVSEGVSRADRTGALLSGLLAGESGTGLDPEAGLRIQFPLTLLLIRPADTRLVSERYGDDPSAFIRLVSDLLRQNLLLRPSGEALAISFERFAVFFNASGTDSKDASETASAFFEDFSRAARNYLGMDFEARNAGPCASAEELRTAYAEAENRFSVTSRLVVRTRRFVRERYSDPGLDLAAIAAYAEVSKNHLSWEYARETGENLSTFISRVRVEAAKQLLSDTALKTYEIAEKTGFSNVETFCRVFKKIAGTTPRGFGS